MATVSSTPNGAFGRLGIAFFQTIELALGGVSEDRVVGCSDNPRQVLDGSGVISALLLELTQDENQPRLFRTQRQAFPEMGDPFGNILVPFEKDMS